MAGDGYKKFQPDRLTSFGDIALDHNGTCGLERRYIWTRTPKDFPPLFLHVVTTKTADFVFSLPENGHNSSFLFSLYSRKLPLRGISARSGSPGSSMFGTRQAQLGYLGQGDISGHQKIGLGCHSHLCEQL